MDPISFLDVARDLANGRTEAHWRTSVSRSYYALFNVVTANLSDTVSWRKDASDHQKVIEFLRGARQSAGDQEEDVASALDDLRENRNLADYDMDTPFRSSRSAGVVVAKAHLAIQAFQGIQRAALRQRIRLHLERTNQLNFLRRQTL
jgi:uncharacterized protein (UPF0332 family)